MDNKFQFTMPAELVKGEDGNYKIQGLASTSSVDRQGEVLLPENFDMSVVDSGAGYLNLEHKNDPANRIGCIDSYSKTKRGLFIKGQLFKGHRTAEDVKAIMNGLEKAGSKSKWGLSVEGQVLSRCEKNPKIIKKAKIKGVALTFSPVNTDTYAELSKSMKEENDLIKSLVEAEELEFDCGTSEATNTEPTTFTAAQVIELLSKALSVGAEAATTLPADISGGAALAVEDLDKKLKKKKKLKKGDSEFYKALSVEVLEKLKQLYPTVETSALWEIVRDRIHYKVEA
jgi:hypothetical protein